MPWVGWTTTGDGNGDRGVEFGDRRRGQWTDRDPGDRGRRFTTASTLHFLDLFRQEGEKGQVSDAGVRRRSAWAVAAMAPYRPGSRNAAALGDQPGRRRCGPTLAGMAT